MDKNTPSRTLSTILTNTTMKPFDDRLFDDLKDISKKINEGCGSSERLTSEVRVTH